MAGIMMDYWETHVAVVDSGDIRPLEPNQILTIECEWYTAEQYAAHDHALNWHTTAMVSFRMDENEDIEVVSAPAPVACVGYRILD